MPVYNLSMLWWEVESVLLYIMYLDFCGKARSIEMFSHAFDFVDLQGVAQ